MVGALPNFNLRGATEADYPFLWRAIVLTMRGYLEATSAWNTTAQEELFRRRFDAERWTIVCSEGEDDEPIGGYAVEPRDEDLVLADIYILPEHQSKGIGSAIIKQLIAAAEAEGKPLSLAVLRTNPRARTLYERLGMHVIGEQEHLLVMSTDPNARIAGS